MILALFLFIGHRILRCGGCMVMRLSRFGKGAARLRTARKELEALAIGLDDSRLNAVLVAEELAARPLNQRLGADYLRHLDRLEYLVSVLAMRDTDVAGRAQLLLEAMRRSN